MPSLENLDLRHSGTLYVKTHNIVNRLTKSMIKFLTILVCCDFLSLLPVVQSNKPGVLQDDGN